MPQYPQYPQNFRNLLTTKEEEKMVLAQEAQDLSAYDPYDFVMKNYPNVGDQLLSVGTPGKDYEQTGKARHLFGGKGKVKRSSKGELQEFEAKGSIGSSRAGAFAGGKYDATTGDVEFETGARLGNSGFTIGGDTITRSGFLGLDLDYGFVDADGKIQFSQKDGIRFDGTINAPGVKFEYKELPSEIPNTQVFIKTGTLGTPNVAQKIDSTIEVVAKAGHPLYREGRKTVLDKRNVSFENLLSSVVSKNVKKVISKPNGGSRWVTTEDAVTPEYKNIQKEVSAFFDSLKTDVQHDYHDPIVENVIGRLQEYGYHAPAAYTVSRDVTAAVNCHADKLENIATSSLTAMSIADGLASYYEPKARENQRTGVDFPGNTGSLVKSRTPAGEKARVQAAIAQEVQRSIPTQQAVRVNPVKARREARVSQTKPNLLKSPNQTPTPQAPTPVSQPQSFGQRYGLSPTLSTENIMSMLETKLSKPSLLSELAAKTTTPATDVITAEDAHLIGFAERHGLGWRDV